MGLKTEGNEKLFFKEPIKIVVYYLIFGSIWILFSDKIIRIIARDVFEYADFSTYKGLLFIAVTSVLLFSLIKRSYSKMENLNKKFKEIIVESRNSQHRFIEKELEINDMNKNLTNFFNISLKMLSPVEYSDKLFIQEMFKIASDIAKESDLGSAFLIKKGKLQFIDFRGFTLEELKRTHSDRVVVNLCHKNVILNRDSSMAKLKESAYVGIYRNNQVIGGFALDISKNSDKNYSSDTIKKIQMVHQLSNGFYKIKKESDYKMLLQKDIVQSFITVLEFHDDYTKGHSESVASYCIKIGKSLGLDEKDLDDLYWAAIMHDIGKIIVPSEILNKKERLTDSEYETIKKHPKIGYEMLSKSETLKNISEYILFHHERWDGKGYPEGLKEDEIPLLSQIISVADSWHAMTSERAYKKQLSREEAVEELIKNRGTQFSPEVLDIFIDIIDKVS